MPDAPRVSGFFLGFIIMLTINPDTVVSTELECLTCVLKTTPDCASPVGELFRVMKEFAPTLPGPSGNHNAYGRVYVDSGHVELGMCECRSPYMLPLIIERQQNVIAQALSKMAEGGVRLLLANNNHSGLLQQGCPVWGSHENYLTDAHPKKWGDLILPFLVSRIYGGAGGIEFPSGTFLAAVRPICMELTTGGSTTYNRSIHSTSREEHHMGRAPRRYRYHLILGDGHRSHFNIMLQFAATALAIKAVIFDRKLKQELAQLDYAQNCDWVGLLKEFNVLQTPKGELQIHPRVTQTQRVYLNAAHRYVNALSSVPAWMHEALQDWDDTLTAMERLDRDWLAPRLDAFAKYEYYSAVLRDAKSSWSRLPRKTSLFNELALLDHSYHDFSDPESVFTLMESDGLLDHRVGPLVAPGDEPEPFVPQTGTRATPRARFIKEHAGQDRYLVDWSSIADRQERRTMRSGDPFAEQFDEWSAPRPKPEAGDPALPTFAELQETLRRARRRTGSS